MAIKGAIVGLSIELVIVAMFYAACATSAHAQSAPIAASIVANAADLASTHYALAHGGREANPVLGQSFTDVATRKAAMTAALIVAARLLQAQGHPKIARSLLWFDAGAMAGVAVRNVAIVRK